MPDTKALFMEAGTLEDAMAKEMQEYLDAVNKEVIGDERLRRIPSLSATKGMMEMEMARAEEKEGRGAAEGSSRSR